MRWSTRDLMCGQCFERAFENGMREVRAVAVESDNAPSMGIFSITGREVRKYDASLWKTLTLL